MQRLRALTDSAADAIVSSDSHGRITDWNPAAERAFGYRRDEILGGSIEALVAEPSRAAFWSSVERAARQQRGARPRDIVAVRRTGDEFPVQLTTSAWRRDGRRFYTVVMRDVSRCRETERHLAALTAAVADLLTGHVLEGRYALERLVRTDDTGSLYEARDLEQRGPVMVRVLRAVWPSHRPVPAPPRAVRHAVDVHAVGVTPFGLPFAVMEPLSGETVADRIERGRAISRDEATRWSRAVAEALADAHDHGETHGRLTAASVFLDRADTAAQSVKILDFDLARLDPDAGPPATRAEDLAAFGDLLGVLFGGQPLGHV